MVGEAKKEEGEKMVTMESRLGLGAGTGMG